MIWRLLTSELDQSFFRRHPVEVARDLVGCQIVLSSDTWVIVECEAYGDETDLASHAAVYRRSRGDIMRREPGRLYVYRSYGVHACLNIVAHEPGGAGAILIRALEPLTTGDPSDIRCCSGPGKLTGFLGIDLTWDDLDLFTDSLMRVRLSENSRRVSTSTRIGITRDAERPWRFFDPDSPSISGTRSLNRQVVASRP